MFHVYPSSWLLSLLEILWSVFLTLWLILSKNHLSWTFLYIPLENLSHQCQQFYKHNVQFQVLNLFLALLLSNFGSSSLSTPTADQDTNKIAEAFNRISRFTDWVKRNVADILKLVKNKLTNQIAIHAPGKTCIFNSVLWHVYVYVIYCIKRYQKLCIVSVWFVRNTYYVPLFNFESKGNLINKLKIPCIK